MAEVTINIKGRSYDIACDDGQEDRVLDLAGYIDNKVHDIARSGAAYNEAHLMVLTSLVLADELLEQREAAESGETLVTNNSVQQEAANDEDTKAMADFLDKMTKRIEGIALRLDKAS